MVRLPPKHPSGYDMERVCQEYLDYLQRVQQSGPTQISGITRVINRFGCYLKESGVALTGINIEHVDEFLQLL